MIGYYNFRNYRITLDLKPLKPFSDSWNKHFKYWQRYNLEINLLNLCIIYFIWSGTFTVWKRINKEKNSSYTGTLYNPLVTFQNDIEEEQENMPYSHVTVMRSF
jgi:hypothetical protein